MLSHIFGIVSLRDWDDFANIMVISLFVFILETLKKQDGNLLVIYDNESK